MSLPSILASPDLGAPGVLGRQLLRLAREEALPWATLVTPAQWASLDAADLTHLLLTPPGRLDPGERPLQAAAQQGLAAAGWQLLDAPRPWLRPAEAAWWERLLDLLAEAPTLLPTALLADLGRGWSPDELPASGLGTLLAAELAADTLWRRQFQGDALAAAAALPGVFGVLIAATEQGVLDDAWAARLCADTDPQQLHQVGRAVLGQWPDPTRWGDLLLTLLSRLTAIAQAGNHPASAALVADLQGTFTPEALVALAPRCADTAAQAAAWAALDAWMRRDPARCAAALIDADAWGAWRARAQPRPAARRALALLWLGSPAHAGAAAAPSLTTWQAVMADLADGLDAETLRHLTDPLPRWPWLTGQAPMQLADLAGRCRDLGALAVLAEGLARDPRIASRSSPAAIRARLLAAWPAAGGLSAEAFAWLLREGADAQRAPTLAESGLLLGQAGERLPEALNARVAAVIHALDQDPTAALDAAGRPRLWGRPAFQRALAARLHERNRDGTLPAWAPMLEQHLATLVAPPPMASAPGPTAPGWQAALHRAGLDRLLHLLTATDPQ